MKTEQSLLQQFLTPFHQLIADESADGEMFAEIKRNKLISTCLLVSLPLISIYFALNLVQEKYLLAAVNCLLLLGNVGILYINYVRKYYATRALLVNLSVVVFALPAFFYRNGAENFLLLDIVITMILFNSRWYIYGFSAVNAVLFMAIKTVQYDNLDTGNIGYDRLLVNTLLLLVLLVLSLYYFKLAHIAYQRLIEKKNQALQEQQQQLELQKTALETQNQQLRSLNQSKEKLMAIIAHDMRSPISALQSSLELLQEELISQEEFMEITMKLGLQVATLQEGLFNMLSWSKTQMQGISPAPQAFSFRDLVNDKLRLYRQNIENKQLVIQLDIPGTLMLYADKNHCKVIMRNLLSNAIKFSYTGGVIAVNACIQNGYAIISVIDSGNGMPQEKMQQLFMGAVTPSTAGTLNEIGTGIGLQLCKDFVEKNKGHIAVRPNTPAGTVFTFSLPAVRGAE